jgi:hypothetical protein
MSMDLVAEVLRRNLEMMKMTLADFSDAEMMTRPCPGANHPAWQVGHLVASESRMLAAVGGPAALVPESFLAKFTKETCARDDAGFFPKKSESLDQLAKVREATIKWAIGLKEADLAKPTPEPMRQFVPTVGHLALMLPVHVAMHMGQIQVARRKLGKPILF